MIVIIINNLLWIILAYLIGSINFSILITKISKTKKVITEQGSGNAGATNVARIYGFKLGLLILVLDASKSYWIGFILGILQTKFNNFDQVIPQLVMIFVIIGHIFPLFFNFKGGKGAACLLGMISAISLILAAIGTVIFLTIVLSTKYVSLGSIVTPFAICLFSFLLPYFNAIDTIIYYGDFWFNPLMLFIGWLIITLSHHKNIRNLLARKERKIFFNQTNQEVKWERAHKIREVNFNDEKNEENENSKNKNENISLLDQAISSNKFN